MVAMDETHAVPLSEKDMHRLLEAAREHQMNGHFLFCGTPKFNALAKQICLDNQLDPGDSLLMVFAQEGLPPLLRLSPPNA